MRIRSGGRGRVLVFSLRLNFNSMGLSWGCHVEIRCVYGVQGGLEVLGRFILRGWLEERTDLGLI